MVGFLSGPDTDGAYQDALPKKICLQTEQFHDITVNAIKLFI
jgi:hypothetical protein